MRPQLPRKAATGVCCHHEVAGLLKIVERLRPGPDRLFGSGEGRQPGPADAVCAAEGREDPDAHTGHNAAHRNLFQNAIAPRRFVDSVAGIATLHADGIDATAARN